MIINILPFKIIVIINKFLPAKIHCEGAVKFIGMNSETIFNFGLGERKVLIGKRIKYIRQLIL